MLHRFSKGFRDIVTYRWMRGREEETKGLAQKFTHRYPAGAVVKNPPANAGKHMGFTFHPWVEKMPLE